MPAAGVKLGKLLQRREAEARRLSGRERTPKALRREREMEEQLARSASCSTGSEKHHSRIRICRPAAAQ